MTPFRKGGTHVVDDMEVSDIVEEEATLPAEEVTVNGSSGTALEVPLFATIVRERRVGVVKVGDHNNCTGCQIIRISY